MSNTTAFFSRPLAESDPEIFGAIEKELGRQRHEIELIASENIVSRAVLEAQGSIMTNKYAEGYPGKRYYGGCQFVDVAENLAIERSKWLKASTLLHRKYRWLFGCWRYTLLGKTRDKVTILLNNIYFLLEREVPYQCNNKIGYCPPEAEIHTAIPHVTSNRIFFCIVV